ncbi:MAG TPA: hypothetical protein VF855_05435 [Acidimicrobiales bacterium]
MGDNREAHAAFGCPYCCSYLVDRICIATAHADSCRCRACGASWDEDVRTGEVLGRSDMQSVLVRHPS